jgi:cellobiose-specific phosphotransferase system component IIB
LNTDSDAESYFNEILEQDLDAFGQVRYDDYQDKADIRFISPSVEFMKSVMTRFTPVTRNPIFELNYFKLGQFSASIISNMKGIYDYPYCINGYEFEDLTFYKENNIVLAVCSHESFSYLDLSQSEYESFKKLNLIYSVVVIH